MEKRIKNNLEAGIKLYKAKKYDHALREFLSLHVDAAENTVLSYYLGLCYTKLEKYEEALLYLEQVVTSDLSFVFIFQCRMILGYIYAVTKRLKLAEFEFNKLLEEGFESAKVHCALAYIYYAQNRVDESLEVLEKAIALEPENANALNSLGYILADTRHDPDRAIRYCKQALKSDPKNAAYLDSMGWAYYAAGKVDDAKILLRKALERSPKNPEIVSHLKVVMERSI